jgi:hypothetical protein
MTVQYQGVWSLQSAAQLQSTQRWVTDPLFENTTLLLQADDAANGSQNNTFLDSSSNSFAITRNGNTTQGSFTPFSSQPGAWSNFFNGSSDFLNIGSGYPASLDLGSGNFTIEGWVYLQATTKQLLLGNLNDSNATCTFFVILNNTSASARYEIKFGSSAFNLGAGTLPTNQWVHVCVMRSGTSIFLFENGAQVGATQTYSGSIPVVANQMRVGGAIAGQYPLSGYASNLRMVIGSTIYSTSGFTVPTTPLTAVTNTALLTCQSNRFFDSSANAISITTSGTPSVQAFSPFAPQFQWTPSVIGGSGYFDGTGDFLQTPATGQFAPTGNWTISLWFYPTALASTQDLIGNYTANTGADWTWVVNSNGSIDFYLAGASVITMSAAAGTIRLNQWHFISVSRSTNTVTAFVNGSQVATASYSQTLGSASKAQYVGSRFGSFVCTGYISDVRMVDGQVVTSVPTTPTTTTTGSVTASNTKLLLNFTNAGIFDGTMKNNLETVGNAQVSTAVVKYGSGSMFFDGTGDYLTSYNVGGLFRLGTVYTVEMWFYTTTVAAGNAGLINFATTISGNTGFNLYRSSAEILCNDGATGGTGPSSGAGSVVANVWTHLAVVSNGVTTKVYLNGVERGSYTGTTGSANNMLYVTIGSFNDKSSPFSGYIDDLRVTLGIARYTQNFIPPSVALPRQ